MLILLQSFCSFFIPKVRTFVHILDKGNQDWFAVLSILEDFVQQLKLLSPLLKEPFLRSDNAGCYHNAALLISAPTITRTGGGWRLRITASVRRTAGKMSATERSHPSKHTSQDILMKVINSFRAIKN